MGDLHDYSTKTSFRGYNMEFLHHAKPGVVVGVETGWNVFYERVDKQDYKQGTATISGVQYRYTNSVPIIAETKFYPMSDKKMVNGYVGAGVGTVYASRSTDFGLYRINKDAWQFCLRPEAGMVINMHPGLKAILGVKYYVALNSSDLDGQSFLSANIGLVFTSL
jgi:opacity protein-like surface antigen